MPQVAETSLGPLTLLRVQHQAVLLQPAEHNPEVLVVLLEAPAGHQDVVHVAEAEVQTSQHIIHHALESLAGVTQPKSHP